MSEVFKKIAPHVISKNFYGVPVEGSEVQSLGTETKVPDYIKKEEKKEPEFGFYGTANLVSDVLKSKIRGIEPDSTSNKEISRFVFKATTGVPDILTDVATGALELSSSPKIKQKAEALESSKIKLFGKVADTLASQFGVPSEEIADKETGLVKPYESLEGHALDFATLFAGGIGSYKVLEKTKLFSKTPKDIRTTIATSKDPMNRFIGDYIIKPQNKFTVAAKNFIKDLTRGEIAFAPAAQILFDPNETLATQLKNSEYLDKDNIIAPLVNYLAADEDDSELKKRAKMLLQDGAIATGLQTAFKILGFSVSFLNQTSNQLFSKSVDSLTTLEEDKLISQILPEMKKTIDSSREIPSVVKEDTEKAVKQITKQAFTTNTSVLEAAPTLLYRTKQRWLTINGFYTPKINDAYQANRRNVRAGGNKAYNAAIKLENNINSYINNSVADPITTKGLVPEGTKALTKLESVTEALKINLDKIKVPLDERAGYLVNRFNLSEDVAESILESRKLIDDLSTEFLKLNQVRFITETSMDSSKELMREIILKDIGSYVNRSYKLYTQGSWTPPTKVVQDAEKYFVEEWLRTKGKGISYENTSQDMKDAAARYAKIQIDKVLGKNKKAFNQSTSNAQKVNESILKERQVLPPEIRALMGEIESPAVNVLQTTSKLVDLVESSRFFNAVADLGAGGQPRYPALWDEATDVVRSTIKATVNYEKMTELAYKGVAIDPKEALKGLGVRVEDVFKDSYAVIQFDEFNKIGEVLGKVKKGDNAGKYRVKTRSATGEDEIIYALPKDLEIVVNDKILRGLTELEYEKIIDKSPFIQQGKLITSKDRYYTEGKYIFREKDYAPKGFETPITNTGSFLDQGYYTTPELAKSLEGMHNTFLFSRYLHDHPVVNSWRYVKTITQKNKTVFDPTTQMRNFGGGAQMYTANGWVPWKNGRIAGSIVKNQLSDMRSEQWNTMYTYFQKEGIANTQLASAEWEALMKNADGKTMPEFTMWFTEKVGNLINKSGIELKGNQIDSKWIAKENKFPEQVHSDPLDMPQKVYAEVDNFFKMSMWFSELNTLQKAFPNTPLKELMDDASKLVRNQLPNYDSGVPAGFKSLGFTPVGNFVSYTPEIIRTSANILERSIIEMTSGNPVLMKRGVARLSGFSLVKGGWLGASAYGYTQMNVTKDQNEAMQTILEAPWSKRRNKIVGRAGDSFYYIDPTYLNPYDYFSGAANAVLSAYHEGEFNGDSARQQIQDAIVNSVSEGLRFAHEESIGLKAYKDFTYAYANEKGVTPEGRSVFRDIESRTADTTLVDAMEFLAYTIGPGFLSDARDTSRAVKGTPNPTTGEVKQAKFKMGEFLTGVSIKEINFDAILQRKAGAYSSAINFDLPSVSRKIVNKKEIDAEAERFGNAYMKQQASKFEADQQFYRQLKAFKQLPGYNEYKIADILEEKRARISKDQLFTLFDGKFKATTLSEDKLEAAKEVFGEYHEVFTILDRYRESINGTSLSPLDENKEREGDTKRQIQSIKKGQPKFEYFRESTYAKMKKRMINPDTGRIIGFATGGVVDVPNAPDEPDERIDKLTGLPYNAQAGEAYMDKEDPLRRLGFASGGEVDPLARLGFGQGSIVGTIKEATGLVFKTLKKLVTKSSAVDVSKGGKYLGTESKTRFNADLATKIIAANKNVPFVKRMIDTNDPNYTSSISMEGGKATHAMADRGAFVYPTIFVNSKTNKLEKLEDSAAWKRAKETGEFIEFNTEEQAQWFARNNYKKANQVKQFFNNFNPAQKDKVLNTLKTFGTGDIRPKLQPEAINPPVETFGTGDIRPDLEVKTLLPTEKVLKTLKLFQTDKSRVNTEDNSAIMLNRFEHMLVTSKNPTIMQLNEEERKGFAKFLTAQVLHESELFYEPSGTFNYAGRKATKEQIEAGQSTKTGTYEREDGVDFTTKEHFTNFSSLDDFAEEHVNYLDRQYPTFFKAKTYDEAIIALSKAANKGVYATDMLQHKRIYPNTKGNIIDTNPLTNQYSLKLGRFLGHADKGFLIPKPRIDMVEVTYGDKEKKILVPSDAGKKGKIPEIRGINKGKYINQDFYSALKNNEAAILGQ